MSNLGGMVIIAGQNGSGKSCIFDAIRLLKSIYGGYQGNEWQQWMGEFQINLSNHSSDFLPIFNDKTKELVINCDFRLSEEERKFIIDHDEELLREYIWR
ncbi:MAG: AAA family ATPase, partial [Cyanobacteriota bacterium]